MSVKEEHQTAVETVNEGYCDDPYCSGHSTRYLVCSCGERFRLYALLGEHANEVRVRRIEHLVDVLASEGKDVK